jgi:hypothetical protein
MAHPGLVGEPLQAHKQKGEGQAGVAGLAGLADLAGVPTPECLRLPDPE